jgi:hypothetical protein
MKKILVISLLAIGGIVLGAVTFGTGFLFGRTYFGRAGFSPISMMNSYYPNQRFSMMGIGNNYMMGGYRFGKVQNVKPLTLDQARQAVTAYLARLNNPDLKLKEIMVFDNNAYARISEKSTGIGAMELLVDPVSLSVFPEFGPNMMWNLKYGHMGGSYGMMGRGYGMMGIGYGMMGYSYNAPNLASGTMTVSSEEALKIAQTYIDQQFPGSQAAKDADPFYGYYTIDFLKNGKPAGMLSVNGFSGEVFLHTWHGTFIEMSEE